jgi:pimeloyl-ACP methyl ester carboxylesterase/DNA-binding CsgD family transcriptional regulator
VEVEGVQGRTGAKRLNGVAAFVAPETQYTRSSGLSIAYQVLGEGPLDLVFIPSFVSNLELAWDWPPLAAFYRAFASFARLILFDKRGTGLSDRVKRLPTTEERMDDLRAVMDAVGSQAAAVVGLSEGAPLAISFAAACPERVTQLIVYGPLPKATRSDDYPWAKPAEWWDAVVECFERLWGSPEYMRADVGWRAPSEQDNEEFVRWWAQYRRLGASPGAAADLARMNSQIDVRHLLPGIRVPTTVLVRAGDRVVSVEHGRYVARMVPHARYVELPGEDHLPFVGDASALVSAVAEAVGVSTPVRVDATSLPAPAPLHVDEQAAGLLSAREREVLGWVARGKTNSEIATALYISESTVRKHLQNAYRKLEVTNRTTALARLNGSLAQPEELHVSTVL